MESERQIVLVTGGTGFIGSHCIVEIINEGYDVVVVDNLTNSVQDSLIKVEEITGRSVTFYNCDLLDQTALRNVFSKHKIEYVMHFAAMKAVGESMQVPLHCYKVNVVGTINLVEVMKEHKVFKMVFSSSCTVYGEPKYLPIDEKHPIGKVTSVYGRTKYVMEEMLQDICRAEKQWRVTSLRYFNPIGAHPSGKIGEDPTRAISNIMPYMAQVAIGTRDSLTIFGDDYPTEDGTGVRDYIHIMDLASGHMAALKKLSDGTRYKAYNLGTGKGVSVLQLCEAFEKASNRKITREMLPRRPGDIASTYADSSLAQKELDWQPLYGLDKMCEDFWTWKTMNPNGYRVSEKNGNHQVNGTITN